MKLKIYITQNRKREEERKKIWKGVRGGREEERERERAIRLWSTYRGCKLVVPYKEEETSTNPPLVSFSPRLPAKRVTRFTIHRTRREPPQGKICETSEEIFRRLSFPASFCFSFSLFRVFSSLRPMFRFMICLRSELFFRRARDRCELLYRISYWIELSSLVASSLNFSFRDWFYNLFVLVWIEIRVYRDDGWLENLQNCALISSIYSKSTINWFLDIFKMTRLFSEDDVT